MVGKPPANSLYFYPRSPCGERLEEVEKLSRVIVISIHALLAESDGGLWMSPAGFWAFLSTLSLRRATQLPAPKPPRVIRFLSTLSLRRATPCQSLLCRAPSYFYPRSPCGERPIFAVRPYDAPIFLSTLSLRRATFTMCSLFV